MGTFDYAIAGVLHREGGFVNDPSDPGGATNFGISLRSLSKDINGDGFIDVEDIKELPVAVAISIYYSNYWIKGNLDKLSSELLSCKLLDMCVHMGIKQAWKIAQQAYNDYIGDFDEPLDEDGIPGHDTIQSFNAKAGDWQILSLIRSRQIDFYGTLTITKPELQKYKLGWYRRASI